METTVTWTGLIFTVVAAVLGSSGLFTLIQFLISRHDKKNDKTEELKKSINDLKNSMVESDKKFSESIDALAGQVEHSRVVQSRIRILRANDELRQGSRHSYEYFRQLHQDITEYEQYCRNHPEFKNNEAVNSIEYINRVYQESLDTNNFLG